MFIPFCARSALIKTSCCGVTAFNFEAQQLVVSDPKSDHSQSLSELMRAVILLSNQLVMIYHLVMLIVVMLFRRCLPVCF